MRWAFNQVLLLEWLSVKNITKFVHLFNQSITHQKMAKVHLLKLTWVMAVEVTLWQVTALYGGSV